jgi:zinc transport system permease protein
MFEFLMYAFMQRAFLAGVIIAILSSAVGLFLVLRRMSLLGDGLAHISFGGIAAGVFFGFYPILSALIFSVAGALGIQQLKKMRVYGDAAIAIFFSFGLSLGVVLISLSKGFTVDLFSYLFGSILAVSFTDIEVILAVGIGVLATVYFFYKELIFITFDEISAKASGLPVEKLDTLLVVLTSIVVVLSMRIVGILLVSSLMVIPASISLFAKKSFKITLLGSILIGVVAVVSGLILAYYYDLAAGGAIVMLLVGMFSIALLLKNFLGK